MRALRDSFKLPAPLGARILPPLVRRRARTLSGRWIPFLEPDGDSMATASRGRIAFLSGFLLYFLLLWILWDSPVIYPFQVFVVLLHEASHALAALATGGEVERILLDPSQGGAAHTRGGSRFWILSAGYLGSLLWGVLLVMLALVRRPNPRWIVGILGLAVLLFSLAWVRSWFGFLFGLAFGSALIAIARYLEARVHRTLLLALGLTSVLYAVLDIKSDVLDRPHLRSDAAMLGELTGVPTVVWGVLWIGMALAVSLWLLRWMWKRVG